MRQNKVFARIYFWWKDSCEFKKELSYQNSGESIAVLKTILAIAAFSDFHSRESTISFSVLEDVTGLSRPMVSQAIAWLESKEWIRVSRNKGKRNSYYLVDKNEKYELKGWTKIPYLQIEECLKKLPNKGKKALTAIKNYILILFQRDNKVDFSIISHQKLADYGGALPALIKGGNDLLLSCNLIGYALYVNYDGNLITSKNFYHIKGLYYGKRGQVQQYADHIDYVQANYEFSNRPKPRISHTKNGTELIHVTKDLPF